MKQFLLLLIALLFVGCDESRQTVQTDPLREDQWYISGNTNPEIVNINLNQTTYKGVGSFVAIVDDGVDVFHEDLIDNFSDYNYNYQSSNFDFKANAEHGTSCAGIIGAVANNGKGLRGIAPSSTLVAYNVLQAPSISNFADALTRDIDKVMVSSNSWGDFNSWGEPMPLRDLIEDALLTGTSQGRGGKGIENNLYIYKEVEGSPKSNSIYRYDFNTNQEYIYTLPKSVSIYEMGYIDNKIIIGVREDDNIIGAFNELYITDLDFSFFQHTDLIPNVWSDINTSYQRVFK